MRSIDLTWERPGFPTVVEHATRQQFRFVRSYVPKTSFDDLVEELVRLLVQGARDCRAAFGFLRSGGRALMPDASVNWRSGEDTLDFYARCVPDMAWAFVLSEGHVERLGGLARVLAEAPAAVTRDISVDGHTLIYLQATPMFAIVPEVERSQLADYVRPLLWENRSR